MSWNIERTFRSNTDAGATEKNGCEGGWLPTLPWPNYHKEKKSKGPKASEEAGRVQNKSAGKIEVTSACGGRNQHCNTDIRSISIVSHQSGEPDET